MTDIVNISYPRVFLPVQKEVLDACKKYKYILYSGAYGAGKTILLAHVVIQNCIMHPRSLWFFGSQTVPMLRDTILRTFKEEVELYQDCINKAKLDIKLEKKFLPSIMTYKFFNDSEVLFRSCDEPSKFKSLNLEGFAIDEPVDIDEDVFLMLQGRLRGTHTKHHLGVLAGNPAGRTCWVYEKFFRRKKSEYFTVQTTTYDNIFLPPDYIPGLEQSYDEDYKRRYLYGKWGSFEGQIYKDFSYNKHVGDFNRQRYKYYIGGYDDGFRNPACFLTIGVSSDNELYIVDELYKSDMTSTEIVEEVHELDKRYSFTKIFADPSAQNWISVAREKKLPVRDANNDLNSGISKLKNFFRNDIIFIDKRCKNLVKELESYRYEKDRGSVRKNDSERPIKKDDHACDALRYAITEFNPFKKPTYLAAGKW